MRHPAQRWRWAKIVAALIGVPLVVIGVAVIAYIGLVALAVRDGVARTAGTVTALAVDAPVRIVRDDRGIPHIRATTLHDLYFAQGYVTGSDRLFQIDVTRRYVYGRLSELLGSATLATDERSRVFDPERLVAAQFARLDDRQRAELQAYADGVNAAAVREPMPPEYQAILARFESWRPQDSLACGVATIRDLSDGWDDVIVRDDVLRTVGATGTLRTRGAAAFFPLSDPAYDTPTVGGPHAAIAPLPPLDGVRSSAVSMAAADRSPSTEASVRGSNAFAAGAAHTSTGRALLANDPHLNRSIPGIWHLVDLAAPGFHVVGATLAGTPGVILGHNERIAWGATNGSVAGPRVFSERFETDSGDLYVGAGGGKIRARARDERFIVRFGGVRTRRYLETRHGFVLEASGVLRHAVQWDVVERPLSAFAAFEGLGRARTVEEAIQVLAGYPGPTQNFVLADSDGRVGYALAGAIPDGPWGLRVDPGDVPPSRSLPLVPFAQLPHLAPARDAVVITANNLQYGAGYPYRLSPEYSAPYRAAEIARRLHSGARYDTTLFAAIQADTESLAERELAQRAANAMHRRSADRDALAPAYAALASFDGRFVPESRGATVVERLRFAAAADLAAAHLPPQVVRRYLASDARFVVLMRALRERPHGWFANDDADAFLIAEVRALVRRYGRDGVTTPYGEADAVYARHPLAAFGFGVWNGPLLPGQGGRFSPAVQGALAGQSFRAVWDVGNWDAGGIDIPLGESGEPGSPHYRDLADRYARHALTPLPFSDAAVARAARATLVLER